MSFCFLILGKGRKFKQDAQDQQDIIHQELTARILEACFEVSNELGAGFLESVYEKALVVALSQKRLTVETQVPVKVKFRNVTVGDFYADLVVNDLVICRDQVG